jgi:tetratricopeptide (TPR) repeat protein
MTITGLFKNQKGQARVQLPKPEAVSAMEEYQNRVIEARRANDPKMEAFYLILLGCLHQMRSEPDMAFERFTEALKADASNPDVHMFLGHYYHSQLNDSARAKTEFKEAIRLAIPGGVMVHKAYNCLGLLYLEEGNPVKAGEYLQLSIRVYNGKFGFDLSLAKALVETKRELDSVLAFLMVILDKDPGNLKAKELFALAWSQKGNHGDAKVNSTCLRVDQETFVDYRPDGSQVRLTAVQEISLT